MYNLMRRGSAEFDQILVVFTDLPEPAPAEALELFVETVLVRRAGSHSLPFTGRPDVVEEFASPYTRSYSQPEKTGSCGGSWICGGVSRQRRGVR